jgi:hypothetical protein
LPRLGIIGLAHPRYLKNSGCMHSRGVGLPVQLPHLLLPTVSRYGSTIQR